MDWKVNWSELRDDVESWEPVHFDASQAAGRAALEELLASDRVRAVSDTLEEQLRELLAGREPARKLPAAEMDERVRAHLAGRALEEYGTWVFFPWSARLVHVLPVDEYREVRTDRNRSKITAEEQKRLQGAKIGVLGLSVGNMAAITFALEGIGAHFRIADFDTLSLSNLNRLRGGCHELGVGKTVIAAREMFEIDPYLEIRTYPDGVVASNVEAFLTEGGKLDLLVEECDDLHIKIFIRERARALGIPVVMDTSDRGMLDVERFDREPDRPVMHGLLGGVKADALQGLETKDKVPYFLSIVGGIRMSKRMAASLPEIKESISTWPQLASGVALGGAITADIGRRILLGTHNVSGRWYVDCESITADDLGELHEPAPPRPPREIAPEAQREPSLPPRPAAGIPVTADVVRWLVATGTLAPSAHNAQPWKFRFAGGVLVAEHDPSHDLPTLDFEHGATWVAFGAFLENLCMAAASIGLSVEVKPFPASGIAFEARFAAAPAKSDPLLEWVPRRVTNRRRVTRAPLAGKDASALGDAAASAEAKLQLLTDAAALDEIGALMGACDRLCSFNERIHGESMGGYRWTREEVERHRDGLDVATLELSDSDRAGMQLLSHWPIMETLAQLGGGRVLEDAAKKQIAGASAVALLTLPGTGPESYLRGGRAVQRTWLTAASRGLAIQPITGLPYLFARLERGEGAKLSGEEREQLAALRRRYRGLFDVPEGHAEVLLFRLAHAGPPTARSLRRHLDDVLSVDLA